MGFGGKWNNWRHFFLRWWNWRRGKPIGAVGKNIKIGVDWVGSSKSANFVYEKTEEFFRRAVGV